MQKIFSIALLFCTILATSGCGSPVLQAASMGMTGYDAATLADKYLPRERIDFNKPTGKADAILERRMDERLLIKGYPQLQPYSFNCHVYLVGEIQNKETAAHATEIACSVQGVQSLTTHFFPPTKISDPAKDLSLTHELAKRYKQTQELEDAQIRAKIVQSTALVMGIANEQAKHAALAAARTLPGVTQVVDYVTIQADNTPPCEAPSQEGLERNEQDSHKK